MKKIFIILLFSYNLFAYTNYCTNDYNPSTDVLIYNTQYSSNCAFGLKVDTIYCDSVNGRVKVVDSTTEITVAGTCTASYELYPEKQFKTNVYNVLKNSSCPPGQIKNLDGICEDPPPCISDPMPDKTPLKFGLTFSSCNDYVSIGSLDINSSSYNNLSCFTDTCSDMTEYTLFGDIYYPDSDNDGTPDKCDLDYIDYLNMDCDGDGDKNSLDPDPNDPDINSGNSNNGGCYGIDYNKYIFSPISPFYSFGDYKYESIYTNLPQCETLLSSNVDSVLVYPDKSSSCERDYCFVHYVSDCSYSASDRIPADYIYLSDISNENQCFSVVDGITYDNSVWDVPNSLSCPNTAYCFVHPIKSSTNPDTNSENNDSSMGEIDLNSTTSDLAPLLNAANTTNKHLQDIKDKIDITNDNLNSLSDINNQILTSSKDIKNNTDKTNNKLSSLLSNSDLMNNSLSNINSSLHASTINSKNLVISSINNGKKLDSINSELDNITNNLNSGLFSDVDPFANVDYSDGSESFSEFGVQLANEFGSTYESNIFGLSGLSGVGIPTYSFTFRGKIITIFDSSMLNNFPISEMRALFLFIFAMLGFVHTFRSV